jgi:hypothetical protein
MMSAALGRDVQMTVDVRIILSALWGCLMFVFLLGDVLRIYAGDFTTGELAVAQRRRGCGLWSP